jgi:hypothetical protein
MNPNLLLDPGLHETIRDHVRALVESAPQPSPRPTRTSDGWHVLLTLVRRLRRPQASRHEHRPLGTLGSALCYARVHALRKTSCPHPKGAQST